MTNEQLQGGPEHRMNPQRLNDLGHQLDAYPIKDEAQKQRLIQHLQASEPKQNDQDQPDADTSAGTDEDMPAS